MVRGDVHHVRIGARTNLQDGVVVHVTTDRHPTIIGDDVTVGHRAVLHGCTVKERCLIGIGAIVLDGAVVGAGRDGRGGSAGAARDGGAARHPDAGLAGPRARGRSPRRRWPGFASRPHTTSSWLRATARKAGGAVPVTAQEVLERARSSRASPPIGLKLFAGIAQEKSIPAGTPLFVENMVGESLFIVKSGAVRITQRVDGAEKELAVVGPGEHLGDLALLGKTVRLVSAVAATPCEVLELANRDYQRLQPRSRRPA